MADGLLDAPSSEFAGGRLFERGLHPLAIRTVPPGEAVKGSASRRELAVVFRSVAALVAAGVPLERSLGASEPIARGTLRQALTHAREQLREGHTLAQALDASGGVVPRPVIELLRAGERSGRLARALDQTASHLEGEADLIARVRQSLAYPALLAIAGTVSVAIIGTVVVPKFAVMLADLGEELPPATRLLLLSSAVVSRFGLTLRPLEAGLTSRNTLITTGSAARLVPWIR